MAMKRKIRIIEAVHTAFLPFEVKVDFPDSAFDLIHDRVGFIVFDLEGLPLHEEPHRTCFLADAEAWIESVRQKVISRGYQLDEWRKPAWMSETPRAGDEMDEDEDMEG